MLVFLQQILSGLAAGSLYSLMALGLVLIYRATEIANFAQGEMAMFCTFVAFTAVTFLKLPFILAFIISICFAVILGISVERLAIRPLINSPLISVILATIAINIILHESAGLIWGRYSFPFPSFWEAKPIKAFGLILSREHLGILIISFVLMIALFLFFKITMTGLVMRATSQDHTISLLMGIRVKTVYALTWAMSSVLAAIAGNLFAPVVYLDIDYMETFIIKAFIVMVVGGLDSVLGAVVGGLMLGLMENIIVGYLSSEFRDAISLILIVVVMLVKPTGLFGTMRVKKV
jgi:branched-chain amino acid transport system permease protein